MIYDDESQFSGAVVNLSLFDLYDTWTWRHVESHSQTKMKKMRDDFCNEETEHIIIEPK